MKISKKLSIISAIIALSVAACGTVRQEDRDSWVGQPVSKLDKHPVFLTMRAVRTVASDGTEIRNYVNGANIGGCSGGGLVTSSTVDYATYQSFSSCMAKFAACNNIFYIKGGRVQEYTPIGSGGARCYTDDRTRPDFRGSTNFQ